MLPYLNQSSFKVKNLPFISIAKLDVYVVLESN